MSPRVSVLLPVYNAAPYLAQAVQSVLDQTFTDFELLAHDDGSTDGSLAILQDFAARDARVVVTSEPNKGLIATLNGLIDQAQAELLARMDADDICLPDRFEKQVAWMQDHPETVMLGGATLLIDSAARPIGINVSPTDHDAIDARNLRGITAIDHPTVMMRKSAVASVDGYDPACETAEDIDLWLRLAEIGQLATMEDVLLKYRIHDQSISARQQDLQADTCRRACEAAWARRGIDGRFEYKPWRMENTRASRRDYFIQYGWRAWGAGFRGTWRHYALKALMTDPASAAAWKLLVFGLLRRPDRDS